MVESKSEKPNKKRVEIDGQIDHKKKGKKSQQEWLWIEGEQDRDGWRERDRKTW